MFLRDHGRLAVLTFVALSGVTAAILLVHSRATPTRVDIASGEVPGLPQAGAIASSDPYSAVTDEIVPAPYDDPSPKVTSGNGLSLLLRLASDNSTSPSRHVVELFLMNDSSMSLTLVAPRHSSRGDSSVSNSILDSLTFTTTPDLGFIHGRAQVSSIADDPRFDAPRCQLLPNHALRVSWSADGDGILPYKVDGGPCDMSPFPSPGRYLLVAHVLVALSTGEYATLHSNPATFDAGNLSTPPVRPIVRVLEILDGGTSVRLDAGSQDGIAVGYTYVLRSEKSWHRHLTVTSVESTTSLATVTTGNNGQDPDARALRVGQVAGICRTGS